MALTRVLPCPRVAPCPQVAPVAIHIPQVTPVAIHIKPFGFPSQLQIATRLNVNSHVWNAWERMHGNECNNEQCQRG